VKATIKTSAILVISVSLCLAAVEKPAAPTASATQPFWKKATAPLIHTKYTPANVKLLAGPDLAHRLATFELPGMPGAVDYVPTNPQVVPLLTKSEESYRILSGGLMRDAKPYSDREYKITTMPERFQNLTLLQTKMGHKGIIDARFSVLLSVSKPVFLFLAVDERALKSFEEFGTPAWMQEYSPTGDKIFTDEPVMKATSAGYSVFVKQFQPGQIALGPGCGHPNYNAMYFAFFAEAGQDGK
jgi:hypothetical protein